MMTGEEMLKKYKQAGWKVLRQRGSHVRVGKGSRRETIKITKKDLKKGLEYKLLKRLEEVG